MPRKLFATEPEVINVVKTTTALSGHYVEVATGNENKLREFQRILTDWEIVGRPLNIEEIQDMDPYKVVSYKAKEAYKANGYNPILVEETSLAIFGLGGRPGPLIKYFSEDVEMRRMIAQDWLAGKDRRALAKILIAVFDGAAVHIREGNIEGTIAESLRGTHGFGWDDMFIPDGQPEGENRTFAEMSGAEKDTYSMRRRALEALHDDPFEVGHSISKMPEPYEQELARVRWDKLNKKKALRFAYALECLEDDNPVSEAFTAGKYTPISYESNIYYTRYLPKADSKSLGLILTDVDRSNLKMNRNGTPVIWQFGPERRSLALAQRADFFLSNQRKEVKDILRAMESGETVVPPRCNKGSRTIESVLGMTRDNDVVEITSTYAFRDLGYKKLSSEAYVSRTNSARYGLYNMIGKYPRSIFSIGSMPAISGWRDVLVTAAIGHHAVFTHRNNILAGYIDKQADLIRAAKDVLQNLGLDDDVYERAQRNIGAAIGCSNVEAELANVRTLYEHAGVRLFRIYTINSDPRVIETAHAIRQAFGDEIELFVGQVTDKKQALKLIAPDVAVDGLFFGHGGGRQCTSATNGMAVTTLEEVYSIVTDARFNGVTVAVEGGVGSQVGHLLLMGVDLISYNQQLARCVVELGDIYFEHANGKICMPYHGSASAPTMIIESANPALVRTRLRRGGRTRNVEGKAGYRFYEEKANSMAFYINTFKHYAARTLADVGVNTVAELRAFLRDHDEEMIRVVSSQASAVASAYRNLM
ncbi:MAG: IMP dehydrogenase [Anaerolineae bacterium]|nr:IMP dehydrogenase [Anaerolineae bacterium]